jgi:hypothetical protein
VTVSEYQYTIGTSIYDLLFDWKSAGTATNVVESMLTLEPGQTYYWYVKGYQSSGTWTPIGASNGITVGFPYSIAEARKAPTGSIVILQDAVVSSTPSDLPQLWVESPDRISALKVDAQWAVTYTDKLCIAGTINWVDGIPTIQAPRLLSSVSSEAISPLGMIQKSLANDRTESLSYAGLNPVGLLVSGWGRVTLQDQSVGILYIDDGSRLQDGTGTTESPCTGLRIRYPAGITIPAPGDYIRVTGIRFIEKIILGQDMIVNGEFRPAGTMLYLPVISMRNTEDVVTLESAR